MPIRVDEMSMTTGWVVGLALIATLGSVMSFRLTLNRQSLRHLSRVTKVVRASARRPATDADLAGLREEYRSSGISDVGLPKSPMGKVAEWIEEACNCSEVAEPTAMCLATVGQDGRPSARFVLAKGVDEEGVTWYTNYNSRKGRDLENYPFAALTFWWGPMRRSVRLEGEVSRVSAKESDEYFSSRPLGSRIGAWVSDQSKPVASREELDKRQKFVQERLSPLGNEVPRPPHWGGFLLTPTRVEFWSGQPSRLHDRIVYTLVSTDTSTSNGTAKKRVEVDDPDEGSLENKREAQWEITRLQP